MTGSFVFPSSAAISSVLSKRCVVGGEPRSSVEPSLGTVVSDGTTGKNGCCNDGLIGAGTSILKLNRINQESVFVHADTTMLLDRKGCIFSQC